MKNKLILGLAGLGILGATTFGAVSTFAQTNEGFQSSLIQKIAQRFNLNQADVQQVFDQNKTHRRNQRQQNLTDKLTQAVKEGKITEAQKQAIIAKFADLKNNRADFKNLTPDQRKQAMDQKKTDMHSWATQNGIDLDTLKSILGGPGMGMGGMRGHRGDWK